MDKIKQYVVFAVLGSVVVLAAGWFLLVSPKRSQAAELRTEAATQLTVNAQLENQLKVLKAQAKDLPRQQARLAAVAAKIPDNPALPALIRALTTASTSAGVELVSVTPGTPALSTVAAPVAAAPGAPASAAPAPRAAVAPRGLAAAPGAAGASAGQLATIPLTLNIAGGYFQVEQFVANLENLPRSMRITALTLAPGANPVKPLAVGTVDDGRSLTTTVTGMVFMAANRAQPTAVVVPGSAVAGTGVAPVVPLSPAKK